MPESFTRPRRPETLPLERPLRRLSPGELCSLQPRAAASRASRCSRGASTSTIRSQSVCQPASSKIAASSTTARAWPRRTVRAMARSKVRRIRGWRIASSCRRASGLVKTIAPRARRSIRGGSSGVAAESRIAEPNCPTTCSRRALIEQGVTHCVGVDDERTRSGEQRGHATLAGPDGADQPDHGDRPVLVRAGGPGTSGSVPGGRGMGILVKPEARPSGIRQGSVFNVNVVSTGSFRRSARRGGGAAEMGRCRIRTRPPERIRSGSGSSYSKDAANGCPKGGFRFCRWVPGVVVSPMPRPRQPVARTC